MHLREFAQAGGIGASFHRSILNLEYFQPNPQANVKKMRKESKMQRKSPRKVWDPLAKNLA